MDIMSANALGLALTKDAMGIANAAGLGLIYSNLRYAASRFEMNPTDVDFCMVSALATARRIAYEEGVSTALIALIDDALDTAWTLDTDEFAP